MRVIDSTLITEVGFLPVKPQGSLIGFATCVYDNLFYFSSIAVHTRPEGGIRLVYPRVKGLDVFHPINREVGSLIESRIEGFYRQLMG